MIPMTRMARNGTSSFEMDEDPPIKENDHSEGLEGLDKIAQTDNGCSEDSSGLDEISEQTSTAVRNEDIGLEENPKFMKNELNEDREVIDSCCVINTGNTTQLSVKSDNKKKTYEVQQRSIYLHDVKELA